MKKMPFAICLILLVTAVLACFSANAAPAFDVGDRVVLDECGYGASDGTGGRMKGSMVGKVYEIKKIASGSWVYYPYAIGFPDSPFIEGWVNSEMILSVQDDANSMPDAIHMGSCAWFDYFFQSIPYNPTPSDHIRFEVKNGAIESVTIQQKAYSSLDNQFVISPQGTTFDHAASTVTTQWRMTSQVDLKLFIERFELGISLITGSIFEIPSAEEIIEDMIWAEIDLPELIVNDTVVTIQYVLDPAGTISCHLIE